ncbi:MAG: energy-coupling factor transporter transmembrane component T [Bacillota bacterium]|nr:energy-coupling factor transporter transmembrane component T [Bacillota bacterium]
MPNADTFSSYHPLINFLWFGLVLLFSMFFLHPVCLGMSLSCAFAYSLYLSGGKATRRRLLFLLPLLLMTALLNPAFNHEGATILAYLPNGNPLTWESICYGLAAGVMLAAVLCWFVCYNLVMTSDKFVYLFGRVIPALSLVLSMTLRFVPKFKAQLQIVINAQRGIGRELSGGGLLSRARQGLTVLSIMITWALENAVETADSMRARGYGLPGRSAFSIYRWSRRDSLALAFVLCAVGYIIAGRMCQAFSWRYFPTMQGTLTGFFPISVYAVYLVLLALPLLLDVAAARQWRRKEHIH